MTTPSLFPDRPEKINPAPDRPDPVLWIQRLVIVPSRTPGVDPLREIPFRRGLNIVTVENAGARERRFVGHSVGKTLLVRLIRYCLGEAAFCTRAVRSELSARLPNAYVLAVIAVQGVSWAVSRPIGAGTSSLAIPADDWRAGLADVGHLQRYTDFTDALQRLVAPIFDRLELPHAGRAARWLDQLAWLARDQKCRYRAAHEWRDRESESGAAPLNAEDASLVMRMTLDLLDHQERALVTAHTGLLTKQSQTRARIEQATASLAIRRTQLRDRLKMNAAETWTEEQFLAAADEAAAEQLRRLQGLLEDEQAKTQVQELDDARVAAAAARQAAQQRHTELLAHRQIQTAELETLEKTSNEAFYASFEIESPPCPLAACPLKPTTSARRPGEPDPKFQAKIEVARKDLQRLNDEIETLAGNLEGMKQAAEVAKKTHKEAQQAQQKALCGIEQAVGRVQSIQDEINQYRANGISLEKERKRLAVAEKAVDASLTQQKAARPSVEARRMSLNHYFDRVTKDLLGPDAAGTLELDARLLRPVVSSRLTATGEAVATAAVLGLDIAAMIASVCGLGHHPRLLIHDSPREADLEAQIYERLFEIVAELERVASNACRASSTSSRRPPRRRQDWCAPDTSCSHSTPARLTACCCGIGFDTEKLIGAYWRGREASRPAIDSFSGTFRTSIRPVWASRGASAWPPELTRRCQRSRQAGGAELGHAANTQARSAALLSRGQGNASDPYRRSRRQLEGDGRFQAIRGRRP